MDNFPAVFNVMDYLKTPTLRHYDPTGETERFLHI